MLAYVIKAELREGYKIYIEFSDGLSGITDHREIIRELIDKNKFNEPPRHEWRGITRRVAGRLDQLRKLDQAQSA